MVIISIMCNLILLSAWVYAVYCRNKEEEKAEKYYKIMIKNWNENTKLKEELHNYKKDEQHFDPTKWLEK